MVAVVLACAEAHHLAAQHIVLVGQFAQPLQHGRADAGIVEHQVDLRLRIALLLGQPQAYHDRRAVLAVRPA